MTTRTRDNIPARRTPPASQLLSSKTTSFAQKQIPTHLKSTSKRPTPGDTAHKPTLTARRSTFHDPSSPSTTQNTRLSPNPTLRPSTFSSRTATTQKAGPPLYTRPVSSGKKRFIYVKKQDIGTSAATTKEQIRSPPEKVEVSNVPQPDQQNPKDQESSINEAKEEAIQAGSSNDTKADVLAQEDIPEPIGNAQTKGDNGKDVDLKNDKQDITLVVETEDVSLSQVAETVSNNINQEFSEAHEIRSSTKTDENVTDDPTSEVGEMQKEPAKTDLSDKKEAVGTESEVRETEAQDVGRETGNVAAKTQEPKGKKESVVSNDVIEETASRLREQRKNKVKALAGAFETVISLQEQK